MDVLVRPISADDRDRWAVLFEAYREFYELAADSNVVDRVWSWIVDPTHEVNAQVAVHGDELVGIAHYRSFARPSAGTTGLYLDDLFTAPEARGRGVGRALISSLSELAAAEGHSVLRWITAESNATARALYDRVATQTEWVTYDVPSNRSA